MKGKGEGGSLNKGYQMERKNLKLLYFSPEDSEIKTLNLGYSRLVLGLVLAFFLIAGVTAGLSVLVIKFYQNYKIAQLQRQNSTLVAQLATLEEKLGKIQTKMHELEKFDNDLRVLADLPKVDEEIRNLGTGGTVEFSDFIFEDLPPNLRNNTRKLNIELANLERQVEFQLTSFTEIEKKILADKDRIQHTPSIRPVSTGRLKSRFGRRMDPFLNVVRFHYGIDISAEKGTPVVAPADGVVIEVNNTRNLNRDFGKYIWIDHGYGIKTLYGHLSKIDVRKGQKVKRWQKIGEVGRTGRSTGNHLHYQVLVNNKPIDPINFIYEW